MLHFKTLSVKFLLVFGLWSASKDSWSSLHIGRTVPWPYNIKQRLGKSLCIPFFPLQWNFISKCPFTDKGVIDWRLDWISLSLKPTISLKGSRIFSCSKPSSFWSAKAYLPVFFGNFLSERYATSSFVHLLPRQNPPHLKLLLTWIFFQLTAPEVWNTGSIT